MTLNGEIDLAAIPAIRELALGLLDEAPRVAVDLRGVSFMDSSGLRLLIELQRTADETATALALVRGPQALERLFDLSGISGRITIVDEIGDFGPGAGGLRAV